MMLIRRKSLYKDFQEPSRLFVSISAAEASMCSRITLVRYSTEVDSEKFHHLLQLPHTKTS